MPSWCCLDASLSLSSGLGACFPASKALIKISPLLLSLHCSYSTACFKGVLLLAFAVIAFFSSARTVPDLLGPCFLAANIFLPCHAHPFFSHPSCFLVFVLSFKSFLNGCLSLLFSADMHCSTTCSCPTLFSVLKLLGHARCRPDTMWLALPLAFFPSCLLCFQCHASIEGGVLFCGEFVPLPLFL